MNEIEDLDNLNVKTISEREVQVIFHSLVKNNQLNELRHLVNRPGMKEKINIANNNFFMEICLYGNCEVIDYILFSPEFKPESDSLKEEDKRFAFGSLCKAGDIPRAIQVYDNIEVTQEELNRALQLACIVGKLDVVKFLLNGKTINQTADIHYDSETALNNACRNGHLDIVKYLIESPEIVEHSNIHLELHGMPDYPFVLASEYSQDHIVKYLMQVKGKNKPNIQSGEYSVIKQYVLSNNLEMLKYIIEEEKLDVHLENDYLFLFAAKQQHYNMLEYLILEKDLDKNDNIKQFLHEKSDLQIEEIFYKKELNKKLMNKLKKHTSQSSNKESKKI